VEDEQRRVVLREVRDRVRLLREVEVRRERAAEQRLDERALRRGDDRAPVAVELGEVGRPAEVADGLDSARRLALPASPSRSFSPPDVPSSATRCPPADAPATPIRSGSMEYAFAFARSQRIAALQSSICAGNGATFANRYSTLAVTNPSASIPTVAHGVFDPATQPPP